MKKQIVNYMVDDEKKSITVFYSDDTKSVKDYSFVEEKKTLYEMKQQVLENKDLYEYFKKCLEDDKKPMKRFIIAYAISVGLTIGTIIAAVTISFWFLLALLVSVNGAVMFKEVLKEFKKDEQRYQDYIEKYEKDIFIIEHADSLTNEKVLDAKALEGVSKTTCEFIEGARAKEYIPIINFNTDADIPQSDLEKINENVSAKKLTLKK